MKTKTIEWWNALQKNEDTNVIAAPGDCVVLIDGIAFLIQRKNNWNNVVCWKVKTTKKDLVTIFNNFRAWCAKKKIQYIRVEGVGKHHYKILYLVLRRSPETSGIVYNPTESAEYGRSIWYVKTY